MAKKDLISRKKNEREKENNTLELKIDRNGTEIKPSFRFGSRRMTFRFFDLCTFRNDFSALFDSARDRHIFPNSYDTFRFARVITVTIPIILLALVLTAFDTFSSSERVGQRFDRAVNTLSERTTMSLRRYTRERRAFVSRKYLVSISHRVSRPFPENAFSASVDSCEGWQSRARYERER